MTNERFDDFLKENLDSIEIFDDEDIALLKEYSINNVAELLSATKGLINVKIFNEFSNGEEKLSKIKERILDMVLYDYRNPQIYPTGLIEDE